MLKVRNFANFRAISGNNRWPFISVFTGAAPRRISASGGNSSIPTPASAKTQGKTQAMVEEELRRKLWLKRGKNLDYDLHFQH